MARALLKQNSLEEANCTLRLVPGTEYPSEQYPALVQKIRLVATSGARHTEATAALLPLLLVLMALLRDTHRGE